MPTSTAQTIYATPDASANLALSELALNAAIELERIRTTANVNLRAVGELSKALTERGFTDLALVPVYDRALASGGFSAALSKNDLYSRLREVASKLQTTEEASPQDLNLLRDFCVALHDALLTNRVQNLRQPILGQRRLA